MTDNIVHEAFISVIKQDLRGLNKASAKRFLQSFVKYGVITEADIAELLMSGVFVE